MSFAKPADDSCMNYHPVLAPTGRIKIAHGALALGNGIKYLSKS
jgi:hypothetical protein